MTITPRRDKYEYSTILFTEVSGMGNQRTGIFFYEDARGKHEMRYYDSVFTTLDDFGLDGWLFSDPVVHKTTDLLDDGAANMSGYPDAVPATGSTVFFGKRVLN